MVIDPDQFMIRDAVMEKKFDFSLRDTLQRNRRKGSEKLLHGYRVFVSDHVIPNRETMKEIVEASGGKVRGGF